MGEPCPCSFLRTYSRPSVRPSVRPSASGQCHPTNRFFCPSQRFALARCCLFLPRKRGGDSVHIPRCRRSSPKLRVGSLEKQMGKQRRFTEAYSIGLDEKEQQHYDIYSVLLSPLPFPPPPGAARPGPRRSRIGLLELTAICYENSRSGSGFHFPIQKRNKLR